MKAGFLDFDENGEICIKEKDVLRVHFFMTDELGRTDVRTIFIEKPSDVDKKISGIPNGQKFKKSILNVLENNKKNGNKFGQVVDDLYLDNREAKKEEK